MKTVDIMTRFILSFFVLVLFSAHLGAQNQDRRDVRRGNREFRAGEYGEAMVDYQKALLRDSTSFAAAYNLANTLYRLDRAQDGRAVLDSISGKAPESGYASDYYFNLGNMALAGKDYQAAVDSYRQSLLRNPGDTDAKENYIYAKKMLENRQNNQNQDNQNQDNRDNQEQNDRNQDQDNQNNRDNQEQNDRNQDQDNSDNDGDRNDNGGQQDQPQISPQAAQQMLNAILAKEKETQDKVKKEKAAVLKSRQREKNW